MARILVVDDDRDGCEALSKYLRRFSHTVICEHDGRAGLSALLDYNAELILLDLKMPVMDGFAFLKVVRSYVRFRNIPILVLTAMDLDQDLRLELEEHRVSRDF